MLVAAAAAQWKVPASEIGVAQGRVSHGSGQHATFGELAARAARHQPPTEPPLKDPAKFQLIGKSLPRIDTPEKTSGRAQYTIDVRRPGMLTAVIAHPPRFGAKVKHWDAAAAKKIPGWSRSLKFRAAWQCWRRISGRHAAAAMPS